MTVIEDDWLHINWRLVIKLFKNRHSKTRLRTPVLDSSTFGLLYFCGFLLLFRAGYSTAICQAFFSNCEASFEGYEFYTNMYRRVL